MFKRFLLWILPLIALLLIAVCLLLSPMTHTFAAGAHQTIQQTAPSHSVQPNWFNNGW